MFSARAFCRTWARRETGGEQGRGHGLDNDRDHGGVVSRVCEVGGSSD